MHQFSDVYVISRWCNLYLVFAVTCGEVYCGYFWGLANEFFAHEMLIELINTCSTIAYILEDLIQDSICTYIFHYVKF
jgi:hypothetical protein